MDPRTRLYLERAAFVILGILIALAFGMYSSRSHASVIPWQGSEGAPSTAPRVTSPLVTPPPRQAPQPN